MSFNPSNISFYILPETVEGVTPITGAAVKIDHTPGTSPTFAADALESPMLRSRRASGGTRKVNFRVEGGINAHFKRDAAIDLLLASALSGVWTTNVLKAADHDSSVSILKRISDPAAGTNFDQMFKGVQVTKFDLSVEAGGNAEASFTFLGMDRDEAYELPDEVTLTPASSTLPLTGIDITDVTITGLPGVECRKMTLSVEQTREAKDAFGNPYAVGIGTSGNHKITLELDFYREDGTPDTVLKSDDPRAVSVTIGAGVNGYRFDLPAAQPSLPEDSEDGSKMILTVTFTASDDNTAQTDFSITRLS